MFIGHTAAAFAAKKAAPQIRLGTLLLAAQFADLIFPLFILFGAEHVMPAPGITAFTPYDFYDYPISHSLVTNILWASIFAGIYFLKRREWSGAIILGCTCTESLDAGLYFSSSGYADCTETALVCGIGIVEFYRMDDYSRIVYVCFWSIFVSSRYSASRFHRIICIMVVYRTRSPAVHRRHCQQNSC